MAMAIFSTASSADELAAWTTAMLHSGEVFDLSDIARPKVDKHSTGGVGDKISIPLAPLVASVGVVVPMMSGRGLGHTGGPSTSWRRSPGSPPGSIPTDSGTLLSDSWHGIRRADRDPGPRRPEALRPARRHRHGPLAATDLFVDHVKEARRGAGRLVCSTSRPERSLHEGP